MKVVGRRKQNLSSFRDSFELSSLVTVGQLLSVTTIHAGARESRQLDPQMPSKQSYTRGCEGKSVIQLRERRKSLFDSTNRIN